MRFDACSGQQRTTANNGASAYHLDDAVPTRWRLCLRSAKVGVHRVDVLRAVQLAPLRRRASIVQRVDDAITTNRRQKIGVMFVGRDVQRRRCRQCW